MVLLLVWSTHLDAFPRLCWYNCTDDNTGMASSSSVLTAQPNCAVCSSPGIGTPFKYHQKAAFLQCTQQLLAYEYLVVQSDSCIFACFDIESDLGE